MFKYLKIAFRNVILNKRRTLFIITAVAIGTIIMLLTLSLSSGVRDNMIKNSLATFTGHVNIYGIQNIRGRTLEVLNDFDNIVSILEEEIGDSIDTMRYQISISGDVYHPEKNIKSKQADLIGIDIDKEELYKETAILIDGELDSIQLNNYAIVQESTANRYKLNIGDEFQFMGMVNTEEFGIVYNTIDLTVGAITQDVKESQISDIRVSNETARIFSMNDELDFSLIRIYIDDKNKANELKLQIEESLKNREYTVEESNSFSNMRMFGRMGRGRRGFSGGYFGRSDEITNSIRITTWNSETAYLEQMITTLERISSFLNIVLMAIILVGITNTLIMSIRERTYEVGTLRAIGMRRSSVLLMFLLEGVILGIGGLILGTIAGGGISSMLMFNGIYLGPSNLSVYLINNTLFLKLTFEMILMVAGATLLISGLASLQPSYMASRLSPVIAMEKE